VRWPQMNAYARSGAAVQAAVFPGVRQTSTCCECWRSGSHERWVKNCNPTGVAVEQTSNTARGTPMLSAESRFHFYDASGSRGPVARGSYEARRSARSLLGTRRNGLKPRAHPAPTQQQGVRSYAKSAFTRVFRKIRGLFDNRIGS
jgi:hypothetical protein